MSTPVVQTPFGPLGQAGVPASPVPIMPETTAIDIDPLGYAAALAAPAIEIANILTDNQKAWARWKAYDSNWFKAYAGGAVPWIGTVMVYGWSPYMNMLNQLEEINALGNQWIYPTPSALSKLVS